MYHIHMEVDKHAINIKDPSNYSINKTFQVLIFNHIYSKRISNYIYT